MQIYYPYIYTEMKEGHYKKIGEGSGRIVYDIGNGYVIKYGRNRKGLAQNRQEHQIYHIEHDPVFAGIIGISDDNKILIMERAEPYKNQHRICEYYHIRTIKEIARVPEIRYLVHEYNLVGGDLVKLSSWGELRGRPVLIDYGFTSYVRHKYYNGFF